jgi:hypothetical protein
MIRVSIGIIYFDLTLRPSLMSPTDIKAKRQNELAHTLVTSSGGKKPLSG